MGQDRDDFAGVGLKPEPVVAVTVTCNLGGERQLNLAAHFERDASPDEQNRILDQVMKIADRQKARYDLEKLEENFNVVGMNTRNLVAALSGADVELSTRIKQMKAKLDGQEEGRKEIHDEAYNEHVASDRRGEFKPKGSVLQKLNLADNEIAKTRAAIEAAPADAEHERHKLVQTILRNQEDLRIRRKQINDLRALAGLSGNTEYEDAENAKV